MTMRIEGTVSVAYPSSSSPQPSSSVSAPSKSWKVATTGIEPPSRMKTGRRPKPVSIARSAADAPEIDGVVRIAGGSTLAPGTFARVRVTGADAHDLAARCIATDAAQTPDRPALRAPQRSPD